jgi:hypothetical protein
MVSSCLGPFFEVVVKLRQLEVYRCFKRICPDERPFQTLNGFSESVEWHRMSAHI